jgi:hypothetical protein
MRIGKRIGESKMATLFKPEDLIHCYTSHEAVQDGLLFDLDSILTQNPKPFFLKYITTGLLQKGYYNKTCNKQIELQDAGIADTCRTCPTGIIFIQHGNKNNSGLPCKQTTLNVPNFKDLLNQATQIFRKKPTDDYFVSGIIELPDGREQIIFIVQNETGRYTAVLPEEY